MLLGTLDWIVVVVFLLITLMIGWYAASRAKSSMQDYFLSGRNMPWWLLGISMVATTFSADTPNLVTDIVRENGVSGNWVWWAFLLTGMCTVFIYAKLWRRSSITTDIEFYELRYSGDMAAMLRGFRALYLGFFFNVIIMATVLLAGKKIAGVMLGMDPWVTIVFVSVITVLFSTLGGLRAVVLSDFFQFFVSMTGMIIAVIYILDMPEIGGLDKLLSNPAVQNKINIIPDVNDWNVFVPLLVIPLAVQWWSVWYPGAEPGGGGYIAQRMLSSKDEKGAIKATLLFNVAHYALRPWPWILIALASLVIFPDLNSIADAFPHVQKDIIQHDIAFSAMLSLLPVGLKGLLVASLLAALMSTLSTHLNWGSSYIVNDFYTRFVNPTATKKQEVRVGRSSTIVLMVFAGIVALFMESALESFEILLQIGAGTGLIYLLRWFWWRINAWSEITAMIVSFVIALTFWSFESIIELQSWEKLIIGVLLTSISWILVTLVTTADDDKKLKSFVQLIKPYPYGWKKTYAQLAAEGIHVGSNDSLGRDVINAFVGIILVYTMLFGTGYVLYGNYTLAMVWIALGLACAIFLIRSIQQSPSKKPDVVE